MESSGRSSGDWEDVSDALLALPPVCAPLASDAGDD